MFNKKVLLSAPFIALVIFVASTLYGVYGLCYFNKREETTRDPRNELADRVSELEYRVEVLSSKLDKLEASSMTRVKRRLEAPITIEKSTMTRRNK